MATRRNRKGRHIVTSDWLGGRSPGGRQGISGLSEQAGPLQSDAPEHAVEIGTCGAGERQAGTILVRAGRFADQQQPGGWIALREHEIARRVAQGAAVKVRDGSAQLRQRARAGSRLHCAFDRRAAHPLANPPKLNGRGRAELPLPRSGGGPGRGWRLTTQPINRLILERLVRSPFDLQPQRGEIIHAQTAYSAASARP